MSRVSLCGPSGHDPGGLGGREDSPAAATDAAPCGTVMAGAQGGSEAAAQPGPSGLAWEPSKLGTPQLEQQAGQQQHDSGKGQETAAAGGAAASSSPAPDAAPRGAVDTASGAAAGRRRRAAAGAGSARKRGRGAGGAATSGADEEGSESDASYHGSSDSEWGSRSDSGSGADARKRRQAQAQARRKAARRRELRANRRLQQQQQQQQQHAQLQLQHLRHGQQQRHQAMRPPAGPTSAFYAAANAPASTTGWQQFSGPAACGAPGTALSGLSWAEQQQAVIMQQQQQQQQQQQRLNQAHHSMPMLGCNDPLIAFAAADPWLPIGGAAGARASLGAAGWLGPTSAGSPRAATAAQQHQPGLLNSAVSAPLMPLLQQAGGSVSASAGLPTAMSVGAAPSSFSEGASGLHTDVSDMSSHHLVALLERICTRLRNHLASCRAAGLTAQQALHTPVAAGGGGGPCAPASLIRMRQLLSEELEARQERAAARQQAELAAAMLDAQIDAAAAALLASSPPPASAAAAGLQQQNAAAAAMWAPAAAAAAAAVAAPSGDGFFMEEAPFTMPSSRAAAAAEAQLGGSSFARERAASAPGSFLHATASAPLPGTIMPLQQQQQVQADAPFHSPFCGSAGVPLVAAASAPPPLASASPPPLPRTDTAGAAVASALALLADEEDDGILFAEVDSFLEDFISFHADDGSLSDWLPRATVPEGGAAPLAPAGGSGGSGGSAAALRPPAVLSASASASGPSGQTAVAALSASVTPPSMAPVGLVTPIPAATATPGAQLPPEVQESLRRQFGELMARHARERAAVDAEVRSQTAQVLQSMVASKVSEAQRLRIIQMLAKRQQERASQLEEDHRHQLAIFRASVVQMQEKAAAAAAAAASAAASASAAAFLAGAAGATAMQSAAGGAVSAAMTGSGSGGAQVPISIAGRKVASLDSSPMSEDTAAGRGGSGSAGGGARPAGARGSEETRGPPQASGASPLL